MQGIKVTEILLTEGVNAPDNTLDEDLVFIQCNQCAWSKNIKSMSSPERQRSQTQCRGRQQREDNAVARPIALEDFALDECLARVLSQLIPHLFLSLTESQRLRLGEEVAEQDAVMLRVRDRIVRSCGGYKVCGDKFGTLVHQLVEGMLPVCTGSTPDNWLRT